MPADQYDEDILRVAEQIKRYLAEHPNAADSLKGISKWWLAQQNLNYPPEKVQAALDYLVDVGVMRKSISFGMQAVYAGISKPDRITKH